MTPTALPDFLNELQKRAAGELRTDLYSRILYSTDASLYQVMPYGVLFPKSVDDLQAAVELAARHGIEMPIAEQVHAVLYEGKDVRASVVDLLARSSKDELTGEA